SCIPTQNLMHCLQICDAVKLQKTINNLPLFLKYFDAVWNVIHNLLIFQPKVALDSSHSFLHIVKILLKSLIPVGSQNLVSAQDANIQLQIIQAAKNINRLMTRMAQHENKFAKLVPSLIAEYVSCVQHVTLESNVKDHLISGINRILDLCSDNSLKSLSVNINPSCRDIYANIVKNYKQFKYHGDV
ncbi:urb2 domain-containing protein, partial [Nephila pilipes]